MKNAKVILIFLLAFNLSAVAQESFSATPEAVVAIKPANLFVFYNYTQFENLTDDTLQMRWVKTETIANNRTTAHLGDPMGNWTTAIQDPNFFHNPSDGIDSADFYLPPITGATDKFILQLYPNNEAGALLVKFKFFPVDNPADSLIVTFDFEAIRVATATAEPDVDSGLLIYPNPASGQFFISNSSIDSREVILLSVHGQALQSYSLLPRETIWANCSGIPGGTYFLKVSAKDQLRYKKLFIILKE
ncbi:MAG: T9SS type A sorting domain-containing protein [Phaeodactylibacter sp.]|nr:T9SS type A sorting domain-containing protein [Phaeodactylibacter sp.]MCB0615609.1 T9SS type A sorting domain-containing protein [Phaeodactylibacter sp.]